MAASYRHPQAIVDSRWLAENLTAPDLRVFECTVYLDPPGPDVDAPYVVRSGLEDYQRAHIPGAAFLDLQAELSDNSSPSHLRFTMPAPEDLAEALGRRGLGNDCRVVLYSRTNMQWATRIWWMLRAIGFDHAAVLDGGFDRWQLDGRPTQGGVQDYPAAQLDARPRDGLFAHLDDVKAAMDDRGVCTLNALSPQLHSGEDSRYGRAGRIPGSVNVPATALQDPDDRTFASAETAAAHFAEAGARPDQPVIVYCGGGIAATLDAFLLWQLGYEQVRVYDASMSEWARDISLPMTTG
ncbi:MAG: sulfurtransferase [Pseudomonadota bacterium]